VRTIKIDENTVQDASGVLANGGLVIYPTETLYGVAVDATNKEAVRKLGEYKNRPFGKPYSIAVSNEKMADDYVHLNQTAKNLYKKFLPGPLTIVSKGKHKVTFGIESEDGTLGIRISSLRLVGDIVKRLGRPITATSANASYKKRPYKISDILSNISKKQKSLIDLIIDAGELPRNEPSSVIDTTLDEPITLRLGEIGLTEKNEVLSRNEEATKNIAKEIWQKYESYEGKRAIIFALRGEMGVGKTMFTKGLAKAMGISDLVTSPTFALENEYQTGKERLYHFDAWRIENSRELKSLDFEGLVKSRSVIAIEWAEKVSEYIRVFDEEALVVWVSLKYGESENERLVSWGVS
jgi:L-threonylcarbamoyladenylate synthase